jgi:hypothetical protein
MTMVDRSNLQGDVTWGLEPKALDCIKSGENCLCFESLKNELRYSILSHRWGSNEIVFNEFNTLRSKVPRIWNDTAGK